MFSKYALKHVAYVAELYTTYATYLLHKRLIKIYAVHKLRLDYGSSAGRSSDTLGTSPPVSAERSRTVDL